MYWRIFVDEQLSETMMCEWLDKAVVCGVTASSGEQIGRHDIRNCFTNNADLVTC